MTNRLVEIPANLVKPGDVLVYGNREYRIVNIRVDKASIVKAARDEMKVAASKSAELIKKL